MPKMSQTHMRLSYGMLGLVTFLFFFKNMQWSKVFMFSMIMIINVKVVYLESIRETSFQHPPIEPKKK
jgi:hypothetical protein